MNDTLFKELIQRGFVTVHNLTLGLANTALYKPDLLDWWEYDDKEKN